jgi:hypothetical protein
LISSVTAIDTDRFEVVAFARLLQIAPPGGSVINADKKKPACAMSEQAGKYQIRIES